MPTKPLDEEAIFTAARRIESPEDRAKFIAQACGDDAAVAERVRALLDMHERDSEFLKPPNQTLDYAPITEKPGTMIGPYKLKEQIGEGGFGLVFVAEQQEPVKRKVALKVIKPGMDTREVMARFTAERQALALMDHPNIARVLDAGATDSGRPYFVMELVRGIPITDYCDQNQLSPRDRLDLFITVCQAVQHAHQKGIIHRDIKPSNVLVTSHDGKPVAKVIDFGVAKAINQQLTERSIYTNFAQMIGTPLYMSPEQAEMSGLDIDTRSDIYSLGVLLYELLTGTTPLDKKRFAKAAYDEIRRMIREDEPQKPSTRLSTSDSIASIAAQRHIEPAKLSKLMRGDLDWITMKALEKDRTRRYETANGLAKDVQRYLSDEAVEACPPSVRYRLRKFLVRHRKSAIVAGFSCSALLLGVAGTTWGLVRARHALKAESHQRAIATESAASEARARSLAENNAKQTQEALIVAEKNNYFASISLAHIEWQGNHVARAAEILDGCPAAIRGWEWHYLKNLTKPWIHSFSTAPAYPSVAVFSPDGRQIAAGLSDGKIKIWDADSGVEALSLSAKGGGVNALAFSPDGRLLSAGCGDFGRENDGPPGSVILFDIVAGTELFELKGHAGLVRCVAFSPDGRMLASGSGEAVRLWDSATGVELRSITDRHAVEGLAFSPDGKTLASAERDSTVRFWDPLTGKERGSFRGHSRIVWTVGFSRDGKRMLTASDDQTVKITDVPSMSETLTYRGHTNDVNAAAFNYDGSQIVSAGRDGWIKLWNTSGQETQSLRGHENDIRSVAFSPSGDRLVTASTDMTVKVWDPNRNQAALHLLPVGGGQRFAAFSPDGKTLGVIFGQRRVQHFDVEAGIKKLDVGSSPFDWYSIAFSSDGVQMATGASTGVPRLWDARNGRVLVDFTDDKSNEYVNSISFGPSGSVLASVGYSGVLRLRDLGSGRELWTATGPRKCLAFSPDGRYLASDGPENRLLIWDTASGRKVREFVGHSHQVDAVAYSPDGNFLVSGGYDKTIRVWDSAGREVVVLKGHSGGINTLSFSPDGLRLASGSDDRTVRIWHTPTWHCILTLEGHTDRIDTVAFSGDGHRIATASFDGSVRLWDAAPVSFELDAKRSAGRAIRFHRRHRPLNADLATALRNDSSLTPEAKRAALRIVAQLREDALLLNELSWPVVLKPDSSAAEYKVALHQAEVGSRQEPENGEIVDTLGVAQYRNGHYSDALATLRRAGALLEKSNGGTPSSTLAFIAMAEYRLEQRELAIETLKRAKELAVSKFKDEVSKNLIREAEQLIEGK